MTAFEKEEKISSQLQNSGRKQKLSDRDHPTHPDCLEGSQEYGSENNGRA